MKNSLSLVLLLLSPLCSISYISNADDLYIVSAKCVSDSGLSIYDVELNRRSFDGEIRYRFMGQDIIYKATIEEITEESIKGIAVFGSSRSGETKGKPFSFTYDLQGNTFTELTVSKCARDMDK
jgi:hypothetical protein